MYNIGIFLGFLVAVLYVRRQKVAEPDYCIQRGTYLVRYALEETSFSLRWPSPPFPWLRPTPAAIREVYGFFSIVRLDFVNMRFRFETNNMNIRPV